MHAEGLEPTHLTAPDPKSGAATNYATSALGSAKIVKNPSLRRFQYDCKGGFSGLR